VFAALMFVESWRPPALHKPRYMKAAEQELRDDCEAEHCNQ
jgi:hypothetical protein